MSNNLKLSGNLKELMKEPINYYEDTTVAEYWADWVKSGEGKVLTFRLFDSRDDNYKYGRVLKFDRECVSREPFTSALKYIMQHYEIFDVMRDGTVCCFKNHSKRVSIKDEFNLGKKKY